MLFEIGLFRKKEKERTEKEKKRKEIKIALLSLGYPNSYFHNKRCNILLL